jgi:hypothetical protein
LGGKCQKELALIIVLMIEQCPRPVKESLIIKSVIKGKRKTMRKNPT